MHKVFLSPPANRGIQLSCNVVLLKCTTELLADTEEPDVKLTIEATSVVIEWSHDVCRFLLKWLPVWALKKFKSAETSSGEKNDVGSNFGMYTVHTQSTVTFLLKFRVLLWKHL